MTPEQIDKVRAAMELPGWRDMEGMEYAFVSTPDHPPGRGPWRIRLSDDTSREFAGIQSGYNDGERVVLLGVNPDDAGSAGCLLVLCGADIVVEVYPDATYVYDGDSKEPGPSLGWACIDGPSLGWACIEYAIACGEWPGGTNA